MIDWILDKLEPLGVWGCWIALIIFSLVFVIGGIVLAFAGRDHVAGLAESRRVRGLRPSGGGHQLDNQAQAEDPCGRDRDYPVD